MQKCHSIIVTGKVQDIEGIKEQVLPFDIDLPFEFSKVSSDDEIDVGRKLDKGNFLLTDIKADTLGIRTDTSVLPEINDGINNLNVKFDAFSSRLERILEKLTER